MGLSSDWAIPPHHPLTYIPLCPNIIFLKISGFALLKTYEVNFLGWCVQVRPPTIQYDHICQAILEPLHPRDLTYNLFINFYGSWNSGNLDDVSSLLTCLTLMSVILPRVTHFFPHLATQKCQICIPYLYWSMSCGHHHGNMPYFCNGITPSVLL